MKVLDRIGLGIRYLGGYTVLELNGAVDFTREYRIDRDPFVAAAAELTRHAWEPEEAVA